MRTWCWGMLRYGGSLGHPGEKESNVVSAELQRGSGLWTWVLRCRGGTWGGTHRSEWVEEKGGD